MKVGMDADEWYPVFSVFEADDPARGFDTEMPEDVFLELKRLCKVRNDAEKEIYAIIKSLGIN